MFASNFKKMKHFSSFAFLLLGGFAMLFTSCSKQKSATTGWEYNNPKNGGFQVAEYEGQLTGPGLVLVEGGKEKRLEHPIVDPFWRAFYGALEKYTS